MVFSAGNVEDEEQEVHHIEDKVNPDEADDDSDDERVADIPWLRQARATLGSIHT